MRTPPELDPAILQAALVGGWRLPDFTLDYLPVGFGSHHWLATAIVDGRRWFVTVDEHRAGGSSGGRLERAVRTAAFLRDEAGLEFVIAPISARDGGLLAMVEGGRWSVSLFPFLDVEPVPAGAFATDAERWDAQRLVARIHLATDLVPPNLPRTFNPAISSRDTLLTTVLHHLADPWETGPYAEPAREVLADQRGTIVEAFARYDALCSAVLADPEPWVLTHGEPHAGNVLRLRDGTAQVIVDWDTVALAPKERDLWQLLGDDPAPETSLRPYHLAVGDQAGPRVSKDALALFGLAWDLREIAEYTGWFARPHVESEDMAEGWRDFTASIAALADCPRRHGGEPGERGG